MANSLLRGLILSQKCLTRAQRLMSTLTPEKAGRRAHELAQKGNTKKDCMIDTHLAHAGVRSIDNAPMSPTIHLATTYARPPDGPYHSGDSIYTRSDNPTRLLLEEEIARLECYGKPVDDGQDVVCCAFSSGMMAASGIILAHRAPLHVLLPVDVYHGVPTVLHDVFCRFQVSVERVDMTDAAAIDQAILGVPSDKDLIVWIETPSNPLCQVIDIKSTCQIVQNSGRKATTVVDSTLAPPTIQRPLHQGADLVMHSATKSLGGHSDVLLGVCTASPWTERGRELGPILKQTQIATGGVASSMDAWLTLRGLRTLATRIARQCRTAKQIASFLQNHPMVKEVHYPGLESHPQHEMAKLQMKEGFGCVLSLEMASENLAMALAGALQTIQRATSLGGTETLIEHRASIEPPGRVTSPCGLLRLSVGLEDPSDLIADFENALEIAKHVCSEEE